MKTIKRLNIFKKPGYFFTDMTNMDNFDPELLRIDYFAEFHHGSVVYNIVRCDETDSKPHIVFNNMKCIFRKSGTHTYLVVCESDKNKEILDKYVKNIDQIKEEILLLIINEDENGDDLFVMAKDFMRFSLKTNDNLVYNQKIIIPVCVFQSVSPIE